VIAPARAGRPGAGRAAVEPPSADELESCPFCEGREGRTPPESFAVAAAEREPDTPGWSVRVVPNLYPALERQEVVVSVPRHARSLAELNDAEAALIAEAWRARAAVAAGEGFGYVQALLNEGREAGASLPHSHTQLAWFREVPSAVAGERTQRGDCGVCELLAGGENAIAERDGIVVMAHPAGRLPYELLIAPAEHEPDGFGDGLGVALALLADSIRRLHATAGGPVPLNAWLHTVGHWHIELLPRLTVMAGLELGAGIYVNAVAPEDAAAALRDAF
jgi:UDPglucose--hexose-1-phosphate uridylyltransferase